MHLCFLHLTLVLSVRYVGQYQKKAQQLPAANQTQEVTEQLKGMLTVVKTEGGGGTLDIKVGGTKAKFANLTISKAGPRYKCKEGGVLVNTSCGEWFAKLYTDSDYQLFYIQQQKREKSIRDGALIDIVVNDIGY